MLPSHHDPHPGPAHCPKELVSRRQTTGQTPPPTASYANFGGVAQIGGYQTRPAEYRMAILGG